MSLGGWVNLSPDTDLIHDPVLEEFPNIIVRTLRCKPFFLAHSPILSSEFGVRLPVGMLIRLQRIYNF